MAMAGTKLAFNNINDPRGTLLSKPAYALSRRETFRKQGLIENERPTAVRRQSPNI